MTQNRFEVVFLAVFFICSIGCRENNKITYKFPPPDNSPLPILVEKNVTLPSEEIKVMHKNSRLSSRLNYLNVSGTSILESLYKEFTFPVNFSGVVKFEWAGTAASKPGPTRDVSLECNYFPLTALIYKVVTDTGVEQIYRDGEEVEIQSGDILRVEVDMSTTDCISFFTSFTATLIDQKFFTNKCQDFLIE